MMIPRWMSGAERSVGAPRLPESGRSSVVRTRIGAEYRSEVEWRADPLRCVCRCVHSVGGYLYSAGVNRRRAAARRHSVFLGCLLVSPCRLVGAAVSRPAASLPVVPISEPRWLCICLHAQMSTCLSCPPCTRLPARSFACPSVPHTCVRLSSNCPSEFASLCAPVLASPAVCSVPACLSPVWPAWSEGRLSCMSATSPFTLPASGPPAFIQLCSGLWTAGLQSCAPAVVVTRMCWLKVIITLYPL